MLAPALQVELPMDAASLQLDSQVEITFGVVRVRASGLSYVNYYVPALLLASGLRVGYTLDRPLQLDSQVEITFGVVRVRASGLSYVNYYVPALLLASGLRVGYTLDRPYNVRFLCLFTLCQWIIVTLVPSSACGCIIIATGFSSGNNLYIDLV